MKMTPALRAEILNLHRSGAPRRFIRRLTGATFWQVAAVLNEHEQPQQPPQEEQPPFPR